MEGPVGEAAQVCPRAVAVAARGVRRGQDRRDASCAALEGPSGRLQPLPCLVRLWVPGLRCGSGSRLAHADATCFVGWPSGSVLSILGDNAMRRGGG